MANQEDIDRANVGKEVWNSWTENELKKPLRDRAIVDFSDVPLRGIDFSGFVFPGRANFKGATLVGDACFQGTTFKGRANFEGATFEKLADFQDAIFKEWAYFKGATFDNLADFEGAKFECREGFKYESLVNFNNATFKDMTIFTDTYFEKAPSFHNAVIHQDTAFSSGEAFFKQFPDIESDYAERAYRTLKLAMNKYQSHTEEAGFFKLELKARALKEPWYRRWLYRAYELFSDYGQSVSKPLFWWAGLGVAMFFLYAFILGNPGEAFTVTIAQALPLIGVEKEALKEALETLFPPDGNAPVWFQITRAAHMLASSALIFLALLALRNRFKIK